MWLGKNKWLLAALVTGLAFRILVLFVFFHDLKSDPDAYKQIAINLRLQGVYGQKFGGPDQVPETVVQPTAYRPPLYPLLLSLLVVEEANHSVNPDLNSGNPEQGQSEAGRSETDRVKVSMLGMAIVQLLLGACSIGFAFMVGRNFQLNEPSCFALSMIVALDPIGLRQSCLPMTETMAVAFATLGVWLLTRKHCPLRQPSSKPIASLAVGMVLGIFTLCRPTFLIWGGLLFLFHLATSFYAPRPGRSQKVRISVLLFLGIWIPLLPWTLRNYMVLGKPIFATSHGGYTLFLGNNDSFYDYLKTTQHSPWDGERELEPVVQQIRNDCLQPSEAGEGWTVNEVMKDRMYYQRAVHTIRERPGDFLYACWIRVKRFWSVIPMVASENGNRQVETGFQIIKLGSAIWYSLLFLLAILGVTRLILLLRSRKEEAKARFAQLVPAFLLVVAFQSLHLFYWSNMRMRAPLVVVIGLLALMSFQSRISGKDPTRPVTNSENET